jgi:hypothetical protein
MREVNLHHFENVLTTTFRRYLFTKNLVADNEPELRDAFWSHLQLQDYFNREPMVSAIPAYETSLCIEDLVKRTSPPHLHNRLLDVAAGEIDAKEAQFSDSEWLRRVERMNGEQGAGFLAIDGGTPCGIVGSFLDQDDPTRAWIVSILSSTRYRPAPGEGSWGLGMWACLRKAHRLLLMVTSNNEPAIRFYERLGFIRTGRTDPYPNHPAVIEYEMARPIP